MGSDEPLKSTVDPDLLELLAEAHREAHVHRRRVQRIGLLIIGLLLTVLLLLREFFIHRYHGHSLLSTPQVTFQILGENMKVSAASAAALVAPQVARAGLIYVSSYAGTVTTLNLSGNSLTQVAVDKNCAPQAAWLALNKASNTLYCVEEAWGKTNGSIYSYRTSESGTLKLLKSVPTYGGPVSTVFYGDGGKGLAVAG
jgi:hypothetical protein